MTTRTSLVLAIALAGATTIVGGARSQAPDESTTAAVERAGRYVDAYERAFAALVSEEHQVQTLVRADGRVRKTRELRSDFLLIKTGPEWAQEFRDVIEVDGKPVRNREDRLRKLFLESPKTALEQARAIARESVRHNIGVNRSGNSPLLPLLFLHPRQSARSRFALSGESLTFQEIQSPSLIGILRRGNIRLDLMARGSFVIEAASGRVLAGELTAPGTSGSHSVSLSLAVHYAEDARLTLMVPIDTRERYWFADKPQDDRLEVESTYSNFRRFQVTVDERIKPPK
jgi:hypothetical protein